MATHETKRCEGCNAQLLSGIEKDHGKCTACLRKERMTTTTNAIEGVTAAKPAEPHTPTMLTAKVPSALTSVNIQPLGDQANSELVAFRVTKQTLAKLEAHLKRTKQAKAQFLRAIIDNALGE